MDCATLGSFLVSQGNDSQSPSVVQWVIRIVEWCGKFSESVLAHPPEVGKDQGLLRRSGQQVEINFLAIELSFVESGHGAHCGSTGSTGRSEINWQKWW